MQRHRADGITNLFREEQRSSSFGDDLASDKG